MKTKPIVDISIQKNIEHLKHTLPQGLLLTGDSGVGLLTIAKYLAGTSHQVIVPEKQGASELFSIPISAIRELYEQTRGVRTKVHTIIIDDADTMSINAQNAFLKLLEEPQQNIHFILTSHNEGTILPTIRSRVQNVHFPKLSLRQYTELLDGLGLTGTQKQQISYLSAGLPAETYRLSSDTTKLEQKGEVLRDAKRLLDSSAYIKLTIAHRYFSNRHNSLELISSIIIILRNRLSNQADYSTLQLLDQYSAAYDAISQQNASPRLQLLRIMVQ